MTTNEVMTPRDVFNRLTKLLEIEPKRTEGITALYQFNITGEQGGKWYVNITDGRAKVGEGELDTPDCTITMRDADYVAMSTGELRGDIAFMTGKLRVKGNQRLAMKSREIFG